MKTRIGILGGTGMLGNNIAREVLKYPENELYIIHRSTSNLEYINDISFKSLLANLNDPQSLKDAFSNLDYVFNCAAYYPTDKRPLKKEIATAESQMNNFINAVSQSNLKKALYLGGAIAIPKSPTGIAKEEDIYEDGNRNVVYGGDAARGLYLALMKGRIGERYLITGDNVSIKEIIEKVNAKLGISKMPRAVSFSIAKKLAKIYQWKYALLGGTKSKVELGYEPQVNIDEMLDIMIEGFRLKDYIKA